VPATLRPHGRTWVRDRGTDHRWGPCRGAVVPPLGRRLRSPRARARHRAPPRPGREDRGEARLRQGLRDARTSVTARRTGRTFRRPIGNPAPGAGTVGDRHLSVRGLPNPYGALRPGSPPEAPE